MSGPDPKPWLEDGASGDLRALLESARADDPTAQQLASVAAKLGPLLAGSAAAATASAGSAGSAVAGKTAVGVAAKTGLAAKVLVSVAAVGVVGGAFQAGRVYEEKAAPPKMIERPLPVVVVQPAPVAPAPEPSVEPEPAPEPPAPAPAPRVKKVAPATPEAEASMLESSMGALKAGDYEKALKLCVQHEQRFGRDALLAQEREAIAIEALVKLGRRDEAKRKAAAFKAAWPTSTHLLKVEALVSE